MADFIYVDKENATSRVNLMSRPLNNLHNHTGIVGKSFNTVDKNVVLNQVRRAFGNVNRDAAFIKNSQVSGQKQPVKQISSIKAWKAMKPAVPSSKNKQLNQEKVNDTVLEIKPAITEPQTKISDKINLEEEIEQMHIEPPEIDTFDDIWACEYPIMSVTEAEDSSDGETSILDVSNESVYLCRDWSEAEGDEKSMCDIESIPEDILPEPLDDLIKDDLDFYANLQQL